MKRNSLKNIQIFRLIRNFLITLGVLFAGLVIVAFTTLPYWGYHWLGTSRSVQKWPPETIILLGGSGMPSESNLIRIWYAASAARKCETCRIIIVMPGDTANHTSTPVRIREDLVTRGINPERIRFEATGTNTRFQALECLKQVGEYESILLVTSPEHMRRAVLCFSKAGFQKVNALPAFENASEADFSFNDSDLGGRKSILPETGKKTQLRYQVWNHLKYEILIARELTALSWYRIRGWI
jgi:uncharacterized SAM-binding protein YcdF (DUF218 family)